MNQQSIKTRPSRLKTYWDITKQLTEFVGVLIKPDTAKLYDSIGDDITKLGDNDYQNLDKPFWLNEGFWKEAKTYPKACEALATLVAEAADFSTSDEVLDLGFGFGDQDLFWLKKYNMKKITGINISPLQVEVAKNRIKKDHLENRIEVMVGTATEIPFAENSFDKVIAMECAVHFNTREKFFKEAFRVLKPGGKLVTTDMLPLPGNASRDFWKRIKLRAMSIQEKNMYDRNEYVSKLENLRFINVTKNSIRNYVFPGMAKYWITRLRDQKKMEEVVVELSPEEIEKCEGVQIWEHSYGINDYVLFSAEKPFM